MAISLLPGFANAVIRPFFIVFTLSLTLPTFGFFLLVIDALMLLIVSIRLDAIGA